MGRVRRAFYWGPWSGPLQGGAYTPFHIVFFFQTRAVCAVVDLGEGGGGKGKNPTAGRAKRPDRRRNTTPTTTPHTRQHQQPAPQRNNQQPGKGGGEGPAHAGQYMPGGPRLRPADQKKCPPAAATPRDPAGPRCGRAEGFHPAAAEGKNRDHPGRRSTGECSPPPHPQSRTERGNNPSRKATPDSDKPPRTTAGSMTRETVREATSKAPAGACTRHQEQTGITSYVSLTGNEFPRRSQ